MPSPGEIKVCVAEATADILDDIRREGGLWESLAESKLTQEAPEIRRVVTKILVAAEKQRSREAQALGAKA